MRLLIVDLRWLKHIFFYITFLSYCWAMTGHFYILLSNIVQKIHICYGIDHCLVILSHLSVEIFRIRVRTSNKFQMQYIEYHACHVMIFVVPVGFFKRSFSKRHAVILPTGWIYFSNNLFLYQLFSYGKFKNSFRL